MQIQLEYQQLFPALLLGVCLFIAVLYDVLFQRIPNYITYTTALSAIFLHAAMSGLAGDYFQCIGLFLGVACLSFLI